MLIDSRRLDAGNIFVPVKESSELSLACVTEGGNPKPTLTWEVLLSPGVERHAQKVAAELLELQEFRSDKVCTIFYIIMPYTHTIYTGSNSTSCVWLFVFLYIGNGLGLSECVVGLCVLCLQYPMAATDTAFDTDNTSVMIPKI